MQQLNLRLFWTCLKTMQRIKAADNLRLMQLIGMPNTDENGRREYVDHQQKVIGTTQVSDERDQEGIEKLRQLM